MMYGPFDSHQTATEQQLTVTVRRIAPDVILLVLVGEIDLATGPYLQEKLAQVTRVAPSHLVIDLSGVEFLGSAGLRILAEIHAAQLAVGYHLAIVVGHKSIVTRPLCITGLDRMLDLHAELESAVEACHIHPGTDDGQVRQT